MIVLVTETWCKAFTNVKMNEPVSHLPEWPHLARAQPCDLFLVRIFRLQKPNQNLKLRKYVTHPLNIFACLRKFINLHNQPKSLHKSGALLASYKMYFVPVIGLMWISLAYFSRLPRSFWLLSMSFACFCLWLPAMFNPLKPKSYQHLISPYSFTSKLFIKIMRIYEMIANIRSWLLNKHLLSVPNEMR